SSRFYLICSLFFFDSSPSHRALHPFPTRRSSDLRVLNLLDKEVVENGALRLAVELGAKWPALVPTINRIAQSAVSDRTYRASAHEVFVTPRRVRFNEMEYAVPLEAGPTVIREIAAAIAHRGWAISFPLEVRAAAADDVPLSTATGRATMYIAAHRFIK